MFLEENGKDDAEDVEQLLPMTRLADAPERAFRIRIRRDRKP
jgi:hypothetical protein